MKWFSKAAVGGLLWLTFSGAAFGDTLFITGQTESVDSGGQFSAYLASNPAQQLLIYCVDFQNGEASGVPVNISTPSDLNPLTSAAKTRYGAVPSSLFTFDSGLYNGEQRYVMAAWLSTQYNFSSGVTTADDQIQNAIWTLLNTTGSTAGFPFGDAAGTGTYLPQAINFYTTTPTATLAAFEKGVRIYTSTDTKTYSGPGWSPVSGTQEMIGTVPEPATLGMLGCGLLAIGLFRKRLKA